MILNVNELFSDNAALTVTADSNIIDLGADRDLGVDSTIDVFVKVDTSFTAAGAATAQFQLITDTDSGFATNNKVIYDTGAVGKATLVKGYYPIKVRLPQTTRRYLKITYTVATGPMTAGKITAGLVTGLQNNINYPAPNQA